jgi:hypothetical protein
MGLHWDVLGMGADSITATPPSLLSLTKTHQRNVMSGGSVSNLYITQVPSIVLAEK